MVDAVWRTASNASVAAVGEEPGRFLQMNSILNSVRSTRRTVMKAALGARGLLAMGAGSAMAQGVELNFWDMNWGAPEYAKAAQKLVERYNAENKDGVKVNYRSVSWT